MILAGVAAPCTQPRGRGKVAGTMSPLPRAGPPSDSKFVHFAQRRAGVSVEVRRGLPTPATDPGGTAVRARSLLTTAVLLLGLAVVLGCRCRIAGLLRHRSHGNLCSARSGREAASELLRRRARRCTYRCSRLRAGVRGVDQQLVTGGVAERPCRAVDAFFPTHHPGYIPTDAWEMGDLLPEYLFLGHGHYDHAQEAPPVLNRSRRTILVGTPEHCEQIRSPPGPVHTGRPALGRPG